ncbi:pyruvate, phosphate dikinase [Desulfitibacter alkalitolerans]|uniref:pyruvate, phosphate dikinase n=1 Tax=Desulfitibacter alkalitolerans TaxID=264641 RepID=UPI0004878D86|nr:pyruvate, phosphate dikinase [Desulfitibacter alkalitolerans]
MSKKYLYKFHEGDKEMKSLLGGKGANLAEMTKIGLPVPPGVIISTQACKDYYRDGQKLPEGLKDQILEHIAYLESVTGKGFGDSKNPLLVSVRSGAAVSMPGMMDTILNLGLNDETVKGLARITNDERFAFDCYRRFITMYSDVVMGIEHVAFESILRTYKKKLEIEHDHELTPDDLKMIIQEFKSMLRIKHGSEFPQDPKEQLINAVEAVFKSWQNSRAILYRKLHKIPDSLGTAVNIQSMVFGNMGVKSGTGVAFTRNPSTGVKELYGEYLVNAQGEDVVAGIRTPQPIEKLKEEMPDAYKQFIDTSKLLEKHYKDMQDIEFTIENSKLYILQTRNGKKTAAAAIRIAVDLVREGLITKEEAVGRIDITQLDQLLHPTIDITTNYEVIARGLPASPGAAVGEIVFDADEAESMGKEGINVILVRNETTPDDLNGIVGAQGILTSRGGMTSHAAVVARGMGKPCVCGCDELDIDMEREKLRIGNKIFSRGDIITIDGSTGNVIEGEVPLLVPTLSKEFQTILEWADEIRTLGVRANADNPEDAAKAREFGAKGIGLCRTEHMFMGPERLPIVQKMILSSNDDERKAALEKLLPIQQEDFYGILKAMQGYPVTIRLLDPPLHEFLPNREELIEEIVKLRCLGGSEEELREKEALFAKVKALSESNPMLGHRGCRLGITFPEIYATQVEAVFRAAVQLAKEGVKTVPEIEIPLVMDVNELSTLKEVVDQVAVSVFAEEGVSVEYTVGTMIEVPRACATAGEIAQIADFFSFGTNDLTQTCFGFSRDDAEGKFLHSYLEKKIINENPFVVLDRAGVGRLMEMAVTKGRASREDLLIGICGEHGGDPSSIEYCYQIGLDFVSCSPYRVPVARLAAAQAALRHSN